MSRRTPAAEALCGASQPRAPQIIPDCTTSIFLHKILICFVPCSSFNTNQASLLPAVCQECLHHFLGFFLFFKLTPKMNTEVAAVRHQSLSRPTGVCGWQLSVIPYTVRLHVARSKVIQNNHIPSVHYTLPWKLEQQ